MSRESKIINGSQWGAEKTIYHYESFGWELLSLNGTQITMSRETQNPVYTDLVKYQAKYEAKIEEYNSVTDPRAPGEPKPFKLKLAFWGVVAFVIPGAAYITYKILENKKYKEALAVHKAEVEKRNERRKKIREEMELIVRDSRATFFSKQN